MRTTIITTMLLTSIICSAQTTEQVRAEIREGIMGVMKLMKDAVDELSLNFEDLKVNLNKEAI